MSRLLVYLLGEPSCKCDGSSIRVTRRKTWALLAYLALTDEPTSRESLTALLCPELEHTRARAILRQSLSELKRTVAGNWLTADRKTVELDSDSLWVDVREFRRLLDQARQQRSAANLAAALLSFSRAVDLYRSDFLAGFTLSDSQDFDDWQFAETESLRRELAQAYEELVKGHALLGEFDRSINYARKWLRLDPLAEQVHRHLMQLYAWAGQRTPALRQYEKCSEILSKELDIRPEEKTTRLYESILEGRASTPGASDSLPRRVESGTLLAEELPLPVQKAERRETTRPSPARHNLVEPATPLVGREADLVEIASRLEDASCRLLSLVGVGGVGKTRLAIRAAFNTLEAFSDGVCFVSLAPIRSTASLLSTLARHLKLSFESQEEPKEQLLQYLRDKRMLLVLDNFDYLLEAAGLVDEILARARYIKVMVTTRERLYLQSEWLFEVRGLEFPESRRPEKVEAYSAVRLFLQCAGRVRRDRPFSREEESEVVRICQLVEGMPLAIELAAAWLRAVSPSEISSQIQNNLDFLSGSWRDLPERHRSVRAAFNGSWELLSEEEQVAFKQLSVFRGGFRLEAAERVADTSVALLLRLIDKSLLQSRPSTRFE
ncbi:MAG: BTAD domain-containing putative transcriptional regulator, partial [Acidobacteriota bacterium]